MWKIRVEKRNNVNENCIRILISKFNQNIIFSQEKKSRIINLKTDVQKKKEMGCKGKNNFII